MGLADKHTCGGSIACSKDSAWKVEADGMVTYRCEDHLDAEVKARLTMTPRQTVTITPILR